MVKKEKNNRAETIGQLSAKLSQKEPVYGNPLEQAVAQHENYENNIWETIHKYKKQFINQDFFIVVITKKEKLMQNVIRNYFFGRISCPTPDYDQIVYKYSYKNKDLELIWTIPSKDACLHLLENKHLVVPEEWKLLDFVLKFEDGTLFKLAKRLNGEKLNSKFVNELEEK